MQSFKLRHITSLWLVFGMGLVACAGTEPTPPPQPALTVFPSPSSVATHTPTPLPTSTPTPAPSPTPVRPELLLGQMTLEQKVGQVMAIGFGATAFIPEVKALLNDLHIGAIVVFDANIESPPQLAQLIRDAQEATKANGDPALIVAVDQEGGPVARLRENVGFTEFPSAMAIAATGDVNNARLAAQAMAGEMKAVGINMNLAPDMDVNNNPANPIIGIRSFGSDPLKVSEFGVAVIMAYQSAGIACVAKHFPGHGDTAVDSHLGLPMIPYDLARLNAIELVPFRAAKDAGIAGIMSAHITFPAVDDTPDLPGSLSAKVQTGLLRNGLPESLQFDGLAVSDSLEMGALESAGFTTPKAAAQALAAGADLLTFNSTLDVYRETHALIVSKVQSGEIPQARLDAAVRRVLRAKERFGVLDGALVDVSAVASKVGLSATKQLSADIAAKSITLVRDAAKLLPLKADAKLAVIETPYAVGLSAAFGTPGIDVGVLQVSEQPQPFEIEQALSFAEGKTVIVATYDVAINPTQADLVNALLKANVPVIVIATRSPYDALYLKDAPTVIAIYGTPLFAGLAVALRGQVRMLGVLPVAL
jgi:beta-N-acetylhexosaminidase